MGVEWKRREEYIIQDDGYRTFLDIRYAFSPRQEKTWGFIERSNGEPPQRQHECVSSFPPTRRMLFPYTYLITFMDGSLERYALWDPPDDCPDARIKIFTLEEIERRFENMRDSLPSWVLKGLDGKLIEYLSSLPPHVRRVLDVGREF